MRINHKAGIEMLEKFLQELPPKHRAYACRIVARFYNIGAWDGSVYGPPSELLHGDWTDNPIEEFRRYFKNK